MSVFFFLILLFYSILCFGNDSTSKDKTKDMPPAIGNFILPVSQRPGALVSFGQNVIDKNETQLFVFADNYSGVEHYTVDIIPSILYAITDNFSIFLNVPFAARYKNFNTHSSGIEDVYAQLEYAFYNKDTRRFIDQATAVVNVSAPTGSSTAQPATGYGSPTVFLGLTFDRMYVNWFVFTSHGTTRTSSRDGTKFGDKYYYQAGLGRNLFDIEKKWIFAAMVEVDGQYIERDIINGIKNPNSGGNVVYITPSIWISSKHLTLQLGAGPATMQHLLGVQSLNSYLLVGNLGWSIY